MIGAAVAGAVAWSAAAVLVALAVARAVRVSRAPDPPEVDEQ